MDLFFQLLLNGAINGSHYALLGVGFGLIFATTKVVHFAYGPIYAASAYAGWFAASRLGLPLVAAGAFAMLIGALLGVLSYKLLYRPFEERGSPGLVSLIASLGLFIVIENVIGLIFGTGSRVVENFQAGIYFVGPAFFTGIHVAQVIALVVIASALLLFLRRTSYGKAVLAMTDNAEMAQIIGIQTVRVSMLVFAIGSAIAAAPAFLILLKDGASPHMGFFAVFIAFVAVVVGGIGSIPGAIAGGLAAGMIESLGLWQIPTEWQNAIEFMVLFAVLLLRPQGLFGSRR